jgi:hypothetical protein
MKMWKRSYRLMGLLCGALLLSACHKPTFADLEPGTLKWSLSVVAVQGQEEQQQKVAELIEELSKGKALSAEVRWVAQDQMANTVDQIMQDGHTDLLVMPGSPELAEKVQQATKNERLRVAVVGGTEPALVNNLRHVTHDRGSLLFLAGFLAAEANKDLREPFSVLVEKPLSPADEEWKMIVAGARYGGRTDLPVQVVVGAGGATGKGGATGTNVGKPFVLSGKAAVVMARLPEDVGAKVTARKMALIRTDLSPLPAAQQEYVLAQPVSLLEEALREEIELLLAGRWQGGVTVPLKSKKLFEIVKPSLIRDQGLSTRLELIEEQLNAGRIKPQTYLPEGRSVDARN